MNRNRNPSPALPVNKLAIQIRQEFQQCVTHQDLMEGNWAELRMSDFNLWVAGVGATARKRASLDARLEALPSELVTLKHLLSSLRKSLRDCRISDGTKRQESREIVDMIIENLGMLASVIRRTGHKSRLRRADDDFDPQRQAEFRRHLECVALLRPSEDGVFKQRFVGRERLDVSPTSDFSATGDNNPLTPLQARLVEANLIRRYRFIRAQRHAVKLAGSARQEEGQDAPMAHNPPNRSGGEGQSSPMEVDDDAMLIDPQHARPPEPKPELQNTKASGNAQDRGVVAGPACSSTKASTVDTRVRIEEVRNFTRAAATQITDITAAARYPTLLGSHDRTGEMLRLIMKCPCCCQALPISSVMIEAKWRKHLARDLYPYTCIAERCPTPSALFLTQKDLQEHIETDHTPSRWTCSVCDDPDMTFVELQALVRHLQVEHAEDIMPGSIEAAISWGAVKSYGLTSCPLCNFRGNLKLDNPELIHHVLECTHDFALRALPWPNVDAPVSSVAGTYNLTHPVADPVDTWLRGIIDDDVSQENQPPLTLETRPCDFMILGSGLAQGCGALDYFADNEYFPEQSDSFSSGRTGVKLSAASLPEAENKQIAYDSLFLDLLGLGLPLIAEKHHSPDELAIHLSDIPEGQDSPIDGPALMAIRGQFQLGGEELSMARDYHQPDVLSVGGAQGTLSSEATLYKYGPPIPEISIRPPSPRSLSPVQSHWTLSSSRTGFRHWE
ncbi:hypothetical protein B0T18DRAFT_354861 [Schizothecium vesticola]|uniref:C2H2-type domain-containing protein n=1 Tax=Schizothecium vesticola TaxID=314040 RepID=A0AA40BPK4_9PEZI|nr:hypothetical protein B0T18DRAFT_354861 [Schizothecium vesticola]